MPIQVRPSGRLEISTPETKDKQENPNSFINVPSNANMNDDNQQNQNNHNGVVIEGLPPLPEDRLPSGNTTIVSSMEATSQNNNNNAVNEAHSEMVPMRTSTSPPRANNNNNNNNADEQQQQQQQPLPSSNATVQSFSTVSSCSSASTAQSIQDGEFVMIHHHANTNTDTTTNASQQQQQPLPSMLGNAQNMFAHSGSSQTNNTSTSSPQQLQNPHNSIVAAADQEVVQQQQQQQQQNMQREHTDKPKAEVHHHHKHNNNNNNDDNEIKPFRGEVSACTDGSGAVLSRVVESRAEHGLLANAIEERVEAQKAEAAAEEAHRQKINAGDNTYRKTLLAMISQFEQGWNTSYTVLIRDEEQAFEVIRMNEKTDRKITKRKSPAISPSGSRTSSAGSSTNLVTDKMIQQQKEMIEFATRRDEPSNKKQHRKNSDSPQQQLQDMIAHSPAAISAQTASSSSQQQQLDDNNQQQQKDRPQPMTSTSIPQSFLDKAQEILPAIARSVAAPFQKKQEPCECLGASSGFHRPSCPNRT